jgi:hypothetical protein
MLLLKNNIEPYLTKEKPSHWKVILPFILPSHTVSDIEQILESKRDQKDFRLEVNLINEQPQGVEHYEEHEFSVRKFFEVIFERRFNITLLTTSSINHDPIINNLSNKADYEFLQVDHRMKWHEFLNDPIIIERSQFYSHHLTFKGRRLVKNVALVMEEENFDELYPDLSATSFEYEYLTRGKLTEKVSACSIKLPVGSIIHMTLTP